MTPHWAETLLALQTVDLRIRDMKTRLAMIPREKASLEAQIALAENKLKAAKAKVAAEEKAIKAAESEVTSMNNRIAKLKQQSALVRKNTEYQTMLAEIDMLGKAIGEQESAELEAMDRLETAQSTFKDATRDFNAATESTRADLTEFVDLEKEIKTSVAALEAKRPPLEKAIDGALLSRYTQILKRGQGIPLVKVDQQSICPNCHLKLTTQTVNNARKGQICYCDNCLHIIYAED